MNKSTTALALAVLIGSVTGCAGNRTEPAAAAFTEVEEAIEEAERAEAQRYATQELNVARETLEQAREAERDGDEERASRLAQRAALDAQYAIAVAENEELQTAVQELRDTLATLESELEREQQGGQLRERF